MTQAKCSPHHGNESSNCIDLAKYPDPCPPSFWVQMQGLWDRAETALDAYAIPMTCRKSIYGGQGHDSWAIWMRPEIP